MAIAIVLAVLGAACTIKTKDEAEVLDSTETTVADANVDGAQESRLLEKRVALSEVARFPGELNHISPRGGHDQFYVSSREGQIYEISRDRTRNTNTGAVTFRTRPNPAPFLDISSRVKSDGPEQGLLGFGFSTDGQRLYVNFTNTDDNVQVLEYRVSANRVSPASARELLLIPQPEERSNGAGLFVGPDGYIYIPVGHSGGDDGDPHNAGQDPANLLSSILRIDPEADQGVAYNIPDGNPYREDDVGANEVYVKGVRNPSSVSWDENDQTMYITDRGSNGVQEITVLPWDLGPPIGANLGWPKVNGAMTTDGEDAPDEYLEPIFEYGPDAGCEIVGGAVFRQGYLIEALDGAFMFGDKCSPYIIAVKWRNGQIVDGPLPIIEIGSNKLTAIGDNGAGEVVATTNDGGVFYLVPAG